MNKNIKLTAFFFGLMFCRSVVFGMEPPLKRRCLGLKKPSGSLHAPKIPALLTNVKDSLSSKIDGGVDLINWRLDGDFYKFDKICKGDKVFSLSDEKINTCSLSLFKKFYQKRQNHVVWAGDMWRKALAVELERKMGEFGFEKNANEDIETAYKRMLSSTYKIYVMPQCCRFFEAIESILEEMLDEDFRSKIKGFSINRQALNVLDGTLFCEGGSLDFATDEQINETAGNLPKDAYGNFVPAIVIHPTVGRENFENVLDVLRKRFGVFSKSFVSSSQMEHLPLISYVQGNDSIELKAAFPSSFKQDVFEYCDDFLNIDVIQDLKSDSE